MCQNYGGAESQYGGTGRITPRLGLLLQLPSVKPI